MRQRGWPRFPNELTLRRLTVNVLGAVAIAFAIVIIVDAHAREDEREDAIAQTRGAVAMLQAELDVRVAGEEGPLGEHVYPMSISPAWFPAQRPTNSLVSEAAPWVDVAEPDEMALRHPRDLTVDGGHGSMFWYNPAIGVVRARVPRTLTDTEAISIYNQVNGTAVHDLKELGMAEGRD